MLNIKHIAKTALLVLAFTASVVMAQSGGNSTVGTLDAWKNDASGNITQRVDSKPIKITGLSTGDCLALDTNNIVVTAACSGGSGGSVVINGVSSSNFTFATTTSGNIELAISTSSNTLTFSPSITTGYNVPLTASTTNWATFYDTPSDRITAGTGLSWAGNTLNANTIATSSINYWQVGSGLLYTATSTDAAKAAYFIGSSTATSTFGGGIDIATGCFAIAGTCFTSGLSSFTSPDSSLTIGGTLTDPTAVINLANANTWTADQTFDEILANTVTAVGSAGVLLQSNSGTDVVLLGAGSGAGATFYGGVNIDGTTRLATSLTGALQASSGTVSAGTLSIANGGTNATSYGANRLIFMNSGNTAFSSDSTLVFDGTNMGLGASSPSAKLHVIKTSEQLRVGYDTSNYYSTTVGSTGIVTFNAVGSGSSFSFSDSVSTSGTLAQAGAASNTGYIRTNTGGLASGTNLNPGVAVFGGSGSGSMYGMDLGYNSTSSRYRTRIFTGSSAGDVAFAFALANPPTSQSDFTEVMTVYGGAGGRVGINQPVPAAKFNVVDGVADFRFSSGSGSVTPTITQLHTGASGKAIVFGAGTSGGYVGWDDAGDFYFKTETRTAINNNTSGSGPNVGVIISSTGNWGLGTATPQARLHVEKTTEQLRVGYNSTNYWNTTTSSTGVTTFDAVGSGSSFIFSDDVSVPDEAYGTGWNGSLEVPTKNAIYDKIETVAATPDYSARVYQTAVTSLTTSWVTIPFAAENFDTDTMHDNATNNSRITFTTAGKYQVGCQVSVTNNSIVGARIRVDGSTVIARQVQGNSAAVEGANATTIYEFTAGQYVECQGYASTQNSTGDADTHMWASLIAL